MKEIQERVFLDADELLIKKICLRNKGISLQVILNKYQ